MSKISLASNASGTGIFTLASPATNTNRTLTLPDSTGTLLDTNGGTITGTLTVTGVATLGNGAVLGVPASGTATNLTGLPLTTGVTGTLPVANGGTNLTSFTSGGVVYASSASVLATGSALTFDGTNLATTGYASAVGLRSLSGGGVRFNNAGNTNFSFITAPAGTGDMQFDTGAGEGMRLTPTGLGIGTSSPTQRLDVSGGSGSPIIALTTTGASPGAAIKFLGVTSAYKNWQIGATFTTTAGALEFTPSTTDGGSTFTTPAMTLNSAGNLGLGVIPSAFTSTIKALQIGPTSVFRAGDSGFTQATFVGSNVRQASAVSYYIADGFATDYTQQGGAHYWSTVASGSAGASFTFTQAMVLNASGNLGIGTSSPSYPLDVRKDASSSSTATIFINPTTGTNAAVLGFNNSGSGGLNIGRSNSAGAGSGLTLTAYDSFVATTGTTGIAFNTNNTNAMYISSGQNVGIGTTSPSNFSGITFGDSILDVNGVIQVRGDATNGAALMQFGGDTYRKAVIFTPVGTDTPYLAFSLVTSGTTSSGSERMRITSAGDVGIGTTSPGRKLEISTTLSGNPTGTGNVGSALRLSNLTEYESNYGTGGGNPDFLGSIEFYSGDTSTGTGVRTAIKTSVDAYYNEHSLRFYTSPANAVGLTERMCISSSGNLGIGTTSPDCLLQVQAADGVVGGAIRYTATSVASVYMSADPNGLCLATDTAGITFRTGVTGNDPTDTGSERVRIDVNGNLLVGTTTASAKLCVEGDISIGNSADAATANFFNTNAGLTTQVIQSISVKAAGTDFTLYRGTSNSSVHVFNVFGNGNVTNTNNSYAGISDVKLKENIVDATPKLANLMQVKVRNYNLKSDPSFKQIGVIAQELETIFPTLVEETKDSDVKGNDLGTTTKSVKYSVFVPMLIKAMQEQQAIIELLKARLDAANL